MRKLNNNHKNPMSIESKHSSGLNELKTNNNEEDTEMNKNAKNAKNAKKATTSVTPAMPAASDLIPFPAATDSTKNAFIPGTYPISGATQNEKYMWLNNAQLQINPKIQRKLSTMRVEKIKNEYSPLIANPIKVSYRDGKFYIFDGMHTRTAIRDINGTDDFPIFCRVYFGLTEEDEARLFAEQFGFSEAVAMGYRLRALNVAKDENVLAFLKTTEDCGFSVTFGSSATVNGHVAAACTAYKAYRDLGAHEYERMMKTLHRTWAGESWSIGRNMLGGMWRFLKMYPVDADAFVRVFRTVTYNDIRSEALRFSGVTKSGAYATALAEIYERGTMAA